MTKLLLMTVLGLEACLVALAWTKPDRTIPLEIGLMMTSVLLYTVSSYAVAQGNPDIHKRVVLGLAILYRVTLFSAQPSLSDDVLRYRWEGEVQSKGGNPYLMRPHDPKIPGAEVRSGYGPLTTLIEAGSYKIAAALSGEAAVQAFWMKLPAVAAEAAILVLLAPLPARQLVWYAWSPVPVIEFWWNGHNDAVPVLCVVAAVLLARGGRWPWALVAIGMGIAAKWWPAVLVPMFAWKAGLEWRRVRWWPVLLAPTGLAALPYLTVPLATFIENARFMSGFVGGWRNNDSVYGVLLWLTGDEYRAKYLAFAIIAMALVWMARWPLEQAVLGSIAATLLASANCHPWYLTWFAPLLVWIRWYPLLVWTALMPLAYVVLIEWRASGVWDGSTAMRWWIWGPVYGSMAVAVVRRSRWLRNRGDGDDTAKETRPGIAASGSGTGAV
jgi:hypothetical protein